MASSPPPSSPAPETLPIPDDDHAADLPLTMSASIILTSLPRDAYAALENAVNIRFKPVGSAPMLRTQVFKITATQRFETVVNFLRTKLKCKPSDSVFLYVNSVFAPALDEVVGNLYRCFKTDDQLIIAYSMTPAFG
ncbi:MAG: Ubiquitin-like protein [Trizodia sp. TS-e1964]|nr:MAG: Ubiquitin-like protein [Trizodia sp. TS-e1964]